MPRAKRQRRPKREIQALLRAEMAQPRKAHSVQVKEVELKVAKAKGRNKTTNKAVRNREELALDALG
jgi:hypothetical protein